VIHSSLMQQMSYSSIVLDLKKSHQKMDVMRATEASAPHIIAPPRTPASAASAALSMRSSGRHTVPSAPDIAPRTRSSTAHAAYVPYLVNVSPVSSSSSKKSSGSGGFVGKSRRYRRTARGSARMAPPAAAAWMDDISGTAPYRAWCAARRTTWPHAM